MKETNILSAWEKLIKQKSVWQHLIIEDLAFYFDSEGEKVFLSSVKTNDLPKSPYTLTFAGKVLTKLSTFANIMSRRPGTEEVTFYSLLNKEHSSFLGKSFDRKMLNIAATPITWRRVQIEKSIKNILKKYILEYKEDFAFIDIGCGGGFDSLEIERIILGINDILDEDKIFLNYEILNIDIDTKWLNNNEKLSRVVSKDRSKINRVNKSIFDYLNEHQYEKDIKNKKNAVVSCNGFAEFLSDEDLKKLYIGIKEMVSIFSGKIHVILPFANRNLKQEKVGDKIGFKFRAKEKEYMIHLIKDIFSEYKVSFEEKHSQIVLIVEK